MSDAYLQSILSREAVDTSIYSPLWQVQNIVSPTISTWANRFLLGISPSGSFSKGTANRSGTDIDLFISIHEDVPETLGQIYTSLFDNMKNAGYKPKKQNVSININVSGYDVDLVPGKRQSAFTTDHSLYRNRASTWTKTNVATHIALVTGSTRQREIRLMKLWRNQKGLDFPSFYLELTVIRALSGVWAGTLSQNIVTCLEYLRDSFQNARVVDPANTNNVISDDLTNVEKAAIKNAATRALAGNWESFVR